MEPAEIFKELTKCKADKRYFAAHYVQTLDEDTKNKEERIKLFPRYPYLLDLLQQLDQPGEWVIDKSRQMMLSWTMMSVIALHGLLFDEAFSMLVSTVNQGKLDNGGSESTPKSLFGKLRFSLERLPDWMRESQKIVLSQNKIINHATGAFIDGETSQNTGRGGQYSKIFCDEFAHFENQGAIHANLTGSTYQWLIYGSTPPTKLHSDDVFVAIADDPEHYEFERIELHWTKHPLRYQGDYDTDGRPTSDWYRQKVKKMGDPDIVAVELDMQRGGLKVSRVYPEFDPEIHVTDSLPHVTEMKRIVIGLDRQFLRESAILVVGIDYDDRVWLMEEVCEPELHISARQDGQRCITSILKELKNNYNWDYVKMGPDEPEVYEDLERESVDFLIVNTKVTQGIREIKANLSEREDGKPGLLVHRSCQNTIRQFQMYRRKKYLEGSFSEEPAKGQIDDCMDALRYACVVTDDERADLDWVSTW
jgi:hypothetical protein